MNKIIIAIIALSALVIMPSVMAISIYHEPNTLEVNMTAPENSSMINITIRNNDNETFYNVTLNSTYLVEYNLTNDTLGPSGEINITGKIETNILNLTNDTSIDTEINITGNLSGNETLMKTIPLRINILYNDTEMQEYLFKRCYIENNTEYCEYVNESEFYQNITIENVTNVTYDVLLPFNTTQEFLQYYRDELINVSEYVRMIAESVEESLNRTAQQNIDRENAIQNSIYIEQFMKDRDNGLWFQIDPENTLMKLTGLSDYEFAQALQILFSQNKIIQNLDNVTRELPTQNGIFVENIVVTSIALKDRIELDQTQNEALFSVSLAALIVIMVIGFFGFYSLYWKKKARWG